jgi:hypothetical protein
MSNAPDLWRGKARLYKVGVSGAPSLKPGTLAPLEKPAPSPIHVHISHASTKPMFGLKGARAGSRVWCARQPSSSAGDQPVHACLATVTSVKRPTMDSRTRLPRGQRRRGPREDAQHEDIGVGRAGRLPSHATVRPWQHTATEYVCREPGTHASLGQRRPWRRRGRRPAGG